ncbi:TonB-dependent receptor [Bacteroides sp. 224]|uniref:TonB-dependent receptor n=1 Tax=Bacteroides sp. 224 TaxID=2302936 RepID=UPI0013D76149|nr:TonB-dependent receptor [Bacteroides sp. 224]NDV66433.1 hypothetical protein [Bacteroides sp. 224]
MKKISLLTVLLLSTCMTFAQNDNKTITVTGTVVEAETSEPAVQATVQLLSLPDSTYTAGIATVAGGNFNLSNVKPGNYALKISYIGFQPSITSLKLNATNPNVNIGTIVIKPDAVMLKETQIVAEAPPVQVKEDTLIYAATAYRTPEGAMLEELIKKLPGAEVSDEGKITINGKEIKKIMVDGKEFFSDDPKVAMKNLPVNMVENVKSYERKSDMARITGIDDGDEESILDLTVKKGMKQGWIGNLIAGMGNKERYEAGGMVSRFQDDASLSIIGSLNNTNNQGFSEFGDAGQGMSDRNAGTGVTASKMLGVNYAKNTEKWQIGGNVKYGFSDNDAYTKRSSEEFTDRGSRFTNNINTANRKRHDARADFRIEWRPDSMTTVIFRPGASYSHTNSSSATWSDVWEGDTLQRVSNRWSSSKSNNYTLNGRLEFYRKLNNKGRNFSLRGSFGYSDGGTDRDSYTTNVYSNDTIPNDTLDLYTDIARDSRNWSIGASYTEPIFKNHFLQMRYEFAHRKQLSESLVYDNLTGNILYVDSLSSRVENFYDTHSIEASIRGIYPKLMYSAGITLTPQSSLSETTIGPNSSKQLPKQNVTNFAPQVMLRYRFDKQHILMLRYRGRSSEPNIEDLQEVIDLSDKSNIRYGNPNLKPTFTHNMMLRYNRYIPTSMSSYTANLSYSNTQNAVTNQITYIEGGTISKKVNVNGNWNARGSFTFNTPLRNRRFTISTTTNATLSDAVSYTRTRQKPGEEVPAELSTTHNLILGERLTGSYRTDNFDVSLKGSVSYNHTTNNKQANSNRETFDYIVGGSTNINLPWQLYLFTDLNYRIKDGYNGDFKKNEAIWNAQLSKNFLKNNRGTIRIKIYDILQEQTNLSRSISANMISDTETNTLGSYFMVHFVYKLNTLGGKSVNRRANFGGGGRPEGMPPRGERPSGGYGGGNFGGGGGRF